MTLLRISVAVSIGFGVLASTGPGAASTVNGAYTFTVVQNDNNFAQSDRFRGSMILEDGSVVTAVLSGAISGVRVGADRIEVVRQDGTRRVITAPPNVQFSENLSANETGQIVVAAFTNFDLSPSQRRSELLLIEPDDTIRTLISSPAIQPPGVADPTVSVVRDVKINEDGTIALSGTFRDATGDTTTRIVRISDTSAVSPTFEILDQGTLSSAPNGRNVGTEVAIDDTGLVAWGVQTQSGGNGRQIVTSDGLGPVTVLNGQTGIGATSYFSSSLTNSGLLAVTDLFNAAGSSDITDGNIDNDFDIAINTITNFNGGIVNGGVDANEFGQVAAIGGVGSNGGGSVALDGETLTSGATNTTNNGQFINDRGQIVYDALFNSQRFVIRADPIGATPDNPILPSAEMDGVFEVEFDLVNALGVEDGSPIYVDPVFGTGLSYTITNGGPNFTSLTVPTQNLGGLSAFDVVFGGFTETIGFGETLDFTSLIAGGVSAFEIFGDGGITSSAEFVGGFTFTGLGRVEMDITNIARDGGGGGPNPDVIPLPASLWLLFSGLGLVGAISRRRG